MALTTSSALLAVIAEKFSPVVSNLTNKAAPFLAKLPVKVVPADVWNFDITTGGATSEWTSSGDSFPTADSDAIAKAIVSLQTIQGTFGIEDRALYTASNGVDPNAYTNLFGARLSEKLNTMLGASTYSIDYALFNGSGSSYEPDGLRNIIATASTVYGIDQSSTTAFQGNVINAGGDALTLDDLEAGFNAVLSDTNQMPDVIVCNPTVAGYMLKLGVADRMLVGNALDPMSSIIAVKGVPLVIDANATDGYAFGVGGISTGETYLAVQMPLVANSDTFVIPSVANDAGMLSIPWVVKHLGVTGTSESYGVYTTCALVVQRPNRCFKLFNFTSPS